MVKSILTRNKLGQGWGIDLVAAVVIFVAGLIILYVYAVNYNNATSNNLNEFLYEGNLASELILSNQDFGILSGREVNQTKLDDFHDNYDSRKRIVGVTHDFYFTMEGLEIDGSGAAYAGKMNSTNTKNFIQISRITIYKKTPTKFLLYIWDE